MRKPLHKIIITEDTLSNIGTWFDRNGVNCKHWILSSLKSYNWLRLLTHSLLRSWLFISELRLRSYHGRKWYIFARKLIQVLHLLELSSDIWGIHRNILACIFIFETQRLFTLEAIAILFDCDLSVLAMSLTPTFVLFSISLRRLLIIRSESCLLLLLLCDSAREKCIHLFYF